MEKIWKNNPAIAFHVLYEKKMEMCPVIFKDIIQIVNKIAFLMILTLSGTILQFF